MRYDRPELDSALNAFDKNKFGVLQDFLSKLATFFLSFVNIGNWILHFHIFKCIMIVSKTSMVYCIFSYFFLLRSI